MFLYCFVSVGYLKNMMKLIKKDIGWLVKKSYLCYTF